MVSGGEQNQANKRNNHFWRLLQFLVCCALRLCFDFFVVVSLFLEELGVWVLISWVFWKLIFEF
jgi:hypothetical protein